MLFFCTRHMAHIFSLCEFLLMQAVLTRQLSLSVGGLLTLTSLCLSILLLPVTCSPAFHCSHFHPFSSSLPIPFLTAPHTVFSCCFHPASSFLPIVLFLPPPNVLCCFHYPPPYTVQFPSFSSNVFLITSTPFLPLFTPPPPYSTLSPLLPSFPPTFPHVVLSSLPHLTLLFKCPLGTKLDSSRQ